MGTPDRTIPCPSCKATVARQSPCYPFCSERCRLIDLGNWIDGRYAIPGEPVTEAGQEPEGEAEERDRRR